MATHISEQDIKELQIAKNLLENPGVAAKITSVIGTPIEKAIRLLPENWNKNIGEVTKTALIKASNAVVFTMKDVPGESASNIWQTWCGGQWRCRWLFWIGGAGGGTADFNINYVAVYRRYCA